MLMKPLHINLCNKCKTNPAFSKPSVMGSGFCNIHGSFPYYVNSRTERCIKCANEKQICQECGKSTKKKLVIYYWWGKDASLEEQTGFKNNDVYSDYDLLKMIQTCFDAGCNVMLLNKDEQLNFCISNRNFGQG